jgi:uncharacterized delta-60 repeat protein
MDAHRTGRVAALVLLSLLSCCVPASAVASFGASDASFSGDGWLTLRGGQTSNAQATAIALQSDRKIVAGGVAMVDGHQRFALTRSLPDSGLDPAFGGGTGKVTTQVGNSDNAQAAAVVVAPDGKIVMVGTARQDNEVRAALVRYDAGGGLDGGFGAGGVKVLPALADGVITVGRAVLASDGDIVFTGTVRDGATVKVFVARIGGDGTPDASFGTGGVQRYLVGDGSCATATALSARPDGTFVAFGTACAPKARGFILKLGANGARVSGFGTNGDVLEDITAATLVTGIVDHTGKFVMVGGTIDPNTSAGTLHTSIARFAADGSLDTSFGTGSDGWTEIVDQDVYNAIDVDELADGRLWITAVAEVGSNPIQGAWGSALTSATGIPDTSYGFQGSGALADQLGYPQTVSGEQTAESVVDGTTLVTAGRASKTIYGGFLEENRTFGVRRYTAAGTRDTHWTSYSVASTPFGLTTATTLRRIVPQPDGSLLVAGDVVDDSVTSGNRHVSTIWRITSAGVPDSAWSGDGAATDAIGQLASLTTDVQTATSGNVYATGQANDSHGDDVMEISKYTSSGSFATFGTGGTLMVTSSSASPGVAPVCSAGPPSLCFDNDGAPGFGGAGKFVFPLSDGGVLAVGTAGPVDSVRGGSGAARILLVRLNADGTPKAGFGLNGQVQLFRAGADRQVPLAATLVNGATKLRVATVLGDSSGHGDVQILQFNLSDGTLDTTFDGDGLADTTSTPSTLFIHSATAFTGGDDFAFAGYANSPFAPTAGRLTGLGVPFAGFGTNGWQTTTVAGVNGFSAGGVAQQGTSTIVGVTGTPSGLRPPAAVAYLQTGALDTSFGSGGLLATARSCGKFSSRDTQIDPQSRLLLGAVGTDPALGGVATISRFVTGAPSADVPCPPTTGAASATGGSAVTPTVTCTPASFDGAQPLTYDVEWLRDTTVIAGATATTYVPTSGDAGHLIACRVTGHNAYGSGKAVSNAVRLPGTVVIEPDQPGEPTTPDEPGGNPSPPSGPADPGPTPAPAPLAMPLPKPLPPLATAIRPSSVFTLPSSKRCVSKRSFKIQIREPKGVKLVSASVTVNNKRVKTLKGKRITAGVDLRGLPKGRFTVGVSARTSDGQTVKQTRKYRTCAASSKKKK